MELPLIGMSAVVLILCIVLAIVAKQQKEYDRGYRATLHRIQCGYKSMELRMSADMLSSTKAKSQAYWRGVYAALDAYEKQG